MNTTFCCKSFDELSNAELYNVLQLRNEVFVVEQNCIYQDADGKDVSAFHLLMFLDERLSGYARLLPAGVSFETISIGRVLASRTNRNKGFGKQLMHRAIQECYHLFGCLPITISAQTYAISFYQNFGFETTGQEYEEDNIPHIQMILKPVALKEKKVLYV